jgi:hypothetical protein
MAKHYGDHYYPEFADAVKCILTDKFIFVIKEQCRDQEESK